jgi:hypothetical protein
MPGARPVATAAPTDDGLSIPMPTPQPVPDRMGGAGRPSGWRGRVTAGTVPPADRPPIAAGRTPASDGREGGGIDPVDAEFRALANAPAATVRVQSPGLLATRWSQARARLGRIPGLLFVDQNDIPGQWPNSLLMGVSAGRGRLAIQPLHRYLPVPGSGVAPLEFDTTLVQWVSDTAREAARLGKAVQDTEAVHISQGWVRLGCLALPLTSDNRDLDRVLCHLYPA